MYILSDIHADARPIVEFIKSDEKYCIQLGDFGFIFDNEETERENVILDELEIMLCNTNKILFTVLGNHDCWPRYLKMEKEEKFGAKCWRIRDNIFAVCPGEILKIENKTFLCIGGADSHDKEWRAKYKKETGVDIWWPQEIITEQDMNNAFENIKKYNNKVDYICTHTPPAALTSRFYYNPDFAISEIALDTLFGKVEFDNWLCGHIHENFNMAIADYTINALEINGVMIV